MYYGSRKQCNERYTWRMMADFTRRIPCSTGLHKSRTCCKTPGVVLAQRQLFIFYFYVYFFALYLPVFVRRLQFLRLPTRLDFKLSHETRGKWMELYATFSKATNNSIVTQVLGNLGNFLSLGICKHMKFTVDWKRKKWTSEWKLFSQMISCLHSDCF